MNAYWEFTAFFCAFMWGVYFLVARLLWRRSRGKNPVEKEFDRRIIRRMGCVVGLVIVITQFGLYINTASFLNPFFWVSAVVYAMGVFGLFWLTDYYLLRKPQTVQKGQG